MTTTVTIKAVLKENCKRAKNYSLPSLLLVHLQFCSIHTGSFVTASFSVILRSKGMGFRSSAALQVSVISCVARDLFLCGKTQMTGFNTSTLPFHQYLQGTTVCHFQCITFANVRLHENAATPWPQVFLQFQLESFVINFVHRTNQLFLLQLMSIAGRYNADGSARSSLVGNSDRMHEQPVRSGRCPRYNTVVLRQQGTVRHIVINTPTKNYFKVAKGKSRPALVLAIDKF